MSVPAQVTNYQCPACTGPLHFDVTLGKLKCDYCESVFIPEEIEAFYAQKDAKAEKAFQEAEQKAAQEQPLPGAEAEPVPETKKATVKKSQWDESTIDDDWGEDAQNMRAYSCPSCGAELMCEQTTAATQCPYCGNPTIVPGQFGGALKPDCVIPFKLKKEDAVAALRRHMKKRIFLPSTFSKTSQINKLQGVYVPFWLFTATAEANCSYEGLISTTRRRGNYRITQTQHFDVRRSGTVRFEKVPTDASKKMPDELMDSIEPFDYTGLKPFSTAYLPGFLADKYDVTVKESAKRAGDRCTNSAKEEMRRDVRGYGMVNNRKQQVRLDREKVQYALLPVWMLHVKWQDKSYLFAMNGQTGKFVGDLPTDRGKFWRLCAAITAAITAVLFFSGAGGVVATAVQEIIHEILA